MYICQVDGSQDLSIARTSVHFCHVHFCNVQIPIDLLATLKPFTYQRVTVSWRDETSIWTYSDPLATTDSSGAAELGNPFYPNQRNWAMEASFSPALSVFHTLSLVHICVENKRIPMKLRKWEFQDLYEQHYFFFLLCELLSQLFHYSDRKLIKIQF